MRKIYLDYAATTYIDPIVLDKMLPFLKGNFGNPSSLYSIGRQAKMGIEYARVSVAKILGASSQEIIFTGSGTESDNLAIFGVAKFYQNKGKHIIVSKIEHKAVLEAAKKLGKEGFEIIYLDVDSKGLVNLLELKKSLRSDTILVSVMYANNEIGTIQPIKEISEIIKEYRREKLKIENWKLKINEMLPAFHCDACQAAGALPLDIKKLGIDALTLNGSKIYGPKGVGCLYLNKNIKIEPIIIGGGQENNLRAGTENPALIVGFAEALKLAEKMRIKESRRLTVLRDYFIKNILKSVKGCKLNGDTKKRLPNNINLLFSGVEGDALVLRLDLHEIYVSTGSACASSDFTASHVLSALGIKKELIHGSLRLTLGRKTTKKDLDYVLKILACEVEDLRKMSAVK